MGLPRGTRAAAMALLISGSLFISSCGNRPTSDKGASITVQLPPARPYRPAVVKPGFSEPLTGAARG